ncbi:MAG: thioredoxin-dependent thiol peroxidase [Rhodospirillales bacterium]|jgi:thioredoxin-dependent peroxiredoxin|nr:thioredoxin-dependent thiol peroxidase [Rhodospirillales bacterium]
MLEAGSKAPNFTAPTDREGELTLSDLQGQKVVLYFYPKDDTPGCTKQAIGFTEQLNAFTKAGAVVIGVSKDPVKKHDKFIAKYGLKIRLVSDEDVAINEAYGVWVEKSMYGRRYMGTNRSTFLIDEAGIIQQIWSKVKVPGHVEEVLKAVQEL